jgi:SAM-dependent methyltransferase
MMEKTLKLTLYDEDIIELERLKSLHNLTDDALFSYLLRLEALGRRFDQIYSVGVLHHLAEPMRGLRTLASLLASGGRMLVGLYSEKSRQDVVAARKFIAERGHVPTDADIRRCRQDLMCVDRGQRFSRLALRTDFYVTSECRDLLFHVQEHRFTLPELRSMLAALHLRFDGFVMSPQVAARYRARNGPPAGLDDVANWEAFETDFPDAFAGMYIFWVRKDP